MTNIYITGDTHNSLDIKKLNTKNFKEQKTLTKKDIVIILGDFGFPWVVGESNEDKWWLDWYNSKNFTTIFIDGNHENFNALDQYEICNFHGAKCHKIRNSVYHILRGEILKIDNLKILCMGGAISTDKESRKRDISWWEQEEPNYSEWTKAFNNIDKANIIISHDGPYSILKEIKKDVEKNSVNMAFEEMLKEIYKNKINIKGWYIGHHHTDKCLKMRNVNFNILYNNILKLKG